MMNTTADVLTTVLLAAFLTAGILLTSLYVRLWRRAVIGGSQVVVALVQTAILGVLLATTVVTGQAVPPWVSWTAAIAVVAIALLWWWRQAHRIRKGLRLPDKREDTQP